jgi:hypothetical protein
MMVHVNNLTPPGVTTLAAGGMARAMRSAVNDFKSKGEAEHRGSVLALASASTHVHLKSVINGVGLYKLNVVDP